MLLADRRRTIEGGSADRGEMAESASAATPLHGSNGTPAPPSASPAAGQDPTLGDTLSGLANDVHHLLRCEVALVRAQIGDRIASLATGAAGVLAGGVVGLVGLVTFVLGIAAALALWLPAWGALLLTGSAVLTIGGLIVWRAVARLADPPRPAPDTVQASETSSPSPPPEVSGSARPLTGAAALLVVTQAA